VAGGAAGGCQSLDNIGRVAAGGNSDRHIPRDGVGLDAPGKDLVEAVVVGDAGEEAGIGEGDGGQGFAVFPEASREFLGKVHGVRHRAAVSKDQHLVSGFQASGDLPRDRFQFPQVRFLFHKAPQGLQGLPQRVLDDPAHLTGFP
jgi:hypothetical protein